MVGFRPGHHSTEHGKQAWSDPELGDCCQADGGKRDKATPCTQLGALSTTAVDAFVVSMGLSKRRERPWACHCRGLSWLLVDIMTVPETLLYEGGGGFLGEVGNLNMLSESVPYAGKLKAAYDRKASFLSSPGGQDQCDMYASLGGTLAQSLG